MRKSIRIRQSRWVHSPSFLLILLGWNMWKHIFDWYSTWKHYHVKSLSSCKHFYTWKHVRVYHRGIHGMFKTNMVDIINKDVKLLASSQYLYDHSLEYCIIIQLTCYHLGYEEYHSKIYADWATLSVNNIIARYLRIEIHVNMKTLNIMTWLLIAILCFSILGWWLKLVHTLNSFYLNIKPMYSLNSLYIHSTLCSWQILHMFQVIMAKNKTEDNVGTLPRNQTIKKNILFLCFIYLFYCNET